MKGFTTNDHSFGDAHGSRAFLSYFPYEQYPNFLSETIRVYPMMYKSFKKFIKDDIWEDGYIDYRPFGTEYPMPSGWAKRLGNFGQKKLGPIDNYYSAKNPYELIYKFTAAAGQDLYEMAARCPAREPSLEKLGRTRLQRLYVLEIQRSMAAVLLRVSRLLRGAFPRVLPFKARAVPHPCGF